MVEGSGEFGELPVINSNSELNLQEDTDSINLKEKGKEENLANLTITFMDFHITLNLTDLKISAALIKPWFNSKDKSYQNIFIYIKNSYEKKTNTMQNKMVGWEG